jgi:stage II sporulation protein D
MNYAAIAHILLLLITLSSDCWYKVAAPPQSNISSPLLCNIKTIRVLMARVQPHTDSLVLCSESGFIISQHNKKVSLSKNRITISYTKKTLLIDSNPYPPATVTIQAKRGCITLDDDRYEGVFKLVVGKSSLLCINELPLEAYVYSVLKTESWPGWPLEVNKVLAIVIRTYAIAMILEAKKLDRPYDLTNTITHQTYTGMYDCPIRKQAVSLTKKQIICHQGKPITAMYSSCCGGVVPAKTNHFDFSQSPYLARSYPCRYCKSSSLYSWQLSYAIPEFMHIIKPVWPHQYKITGITTKKNRSGVAQDICISAYKKEKIVSASTLYRLCNDIISYSFTVSKTRNSIMIKGFGYGHHIGLCQWGAREMIKKGYPYKRVLLFYYPQTYLKNYDRCAI